MKITNRSHKRNLISAAVLTALVSMSAIAEQGDSSKSTDADENIEKIIVTGTSSRGHTALQTSYGVSVLDADAIAEDMPLGMSDLVDAIPGLFGESQGGEVNTAISARGTRQGFNSLVSLQEDGLPMLYSPFFSEFEIRHDLTYSRVESILGGPSGVFTAQGAAATVNFITRMPTENESQIRMSLTDYGQTRTDFFTGGPITDTWTGAIGGYYRRSDDARDNGYTANDGGQFRATLQKDINAGLGLLTFGYKRIDDNTRFQHNHAVEYKNFKATPINGLDPRNETMYGPDLKKINIKTVNGIHPIDAQTGEESKSDQFTFLFDYDFDNGFRYQQKSRVIKIAMDATDMRGANTSEIGLASDYVASNEQKLLDAFDTATSVGLVRLIDGVLINDLDNFNGNGLLSEQKLLSYKKTQNNFISDFKLSYENDFFATTVGLQYWDIETTSHYIQGNFLADVKHQANRYDVTAFDADGNAVGHLTDYGVTAHASNDNSGTLNTESINPYINVEFQVTDDLRIDAGARYEDVTFTATGNDVDNNASMPDSLNSPMSLADDVVVTSPNGQIVHGEVSTSETTWTVGANYLINEEFAVYARYANAHDFGFINEFSYFTIPGYGAPAGSNLGLTTKPAKLEFAEIGTRMDYDDFSLWTTLFFTRNKEMASRVFEADGVLKEIRTDNEALGLEFQGSWEISENFELDFSGVIQDSHLVDNDSDEATSQDGNQIERLPNIQVRIAPRYKFDGGHVFLSVNHYGKRYATNENIIEFDAYTQIDAGVSFKLNEQITLNFQGSNLTNELVFFTRGEGDFTLDAQGNGYGYAQAGLGRTFTVTVDVKF
jgi:outer membrane receptor protein involved in Fe transport